MKNFAKKMGYATDQNGIMNRYLREKQGWDIHLSNTKQFIINSIENAKRGSVLVMGSGWWLDVPVDELTQHFDTVTLVDIVHPPQIVHKAKKYTNLQLIETDLNAGLLQQIYELKHITESELMSVVPNASQMPFDTHNFDFVVSVNLLNQLDTLIVEFIEKKGQWKTESILQFRKRIQDFHLSLLPAAKSCLITDCEEYTAESVDLYQKGNFSTKPLIYTQLPSASSEWEWYFDTQKTYYTNKITILKVRAFRF